MTRRWGRPWTLALLLMPLALGLPGCGGGSGDPALDAQLKMVNEMARQGYPQQALAALAVLRDQFGPRRAIDKLELKIGGHAGSAEEARRVNLGQMALARLTALQDEVEIYSGDHGGRVPLSLDDLPEAGPGGAVPIEPLSNTRTVVSQWDGTGGWAYDPAEGRVRINVKGNDPQGKAYRDYGATPAAAPGAQSPN